ncbi:MAG: hypothetical protein AAF721_42260 [Myxococcota bacterium]
MPRCSQTPLWSLLAVFSTLACGAADAPDEPELAGGKADEPGACAPYDPCAADDPAVERIVHALGGRAALLGLSAFVLESNGTRAWIDEGFSPDGPAEQANEYETRSTFDTTTSAFAIEVERLVTFGGFDAKQTFRQIVHGDVGHVEGIESVFGFPTGDLPSDRVAAIALEQRLLHPHLIGLDLLAHPDLARALPDAEHDGRLYERTEVARPVSPLVLWVDTKSGQLARVVTMESDPLRRDVEVAAVYGDWKPADDDADGARFPRSVRLEHAGQTVLAETRTGVWARPELAPDALELPEAAAPEFVGRDAERGELHHRWHRGFASSGLPQSGVQSHVEATELAPGVFHLTGGSHHSMVIQQAEGVVVLEAPLYEARGLAILDWIEDTLDAPTTHVVVSHFHQDHSAGARTFVARGATLVVGAGSEAHWDTILAAPSSIDPDALSTSGTKVGEVAVVPEDGKLVLDDATNPVTIYDLPSAHAVDMVVPHMPSARAVFIADVYSPHSPAQIEGGPREAQVGLEALGLLSEIDTIAGAHGQGTATLDDLAAAVDAAAGR